MNDRAPYYEFLLTSSTGSGTFTHYIYVGGNYKLGYNDYQKIACEHYTSAKSHLPISGIIFVKSKDGTNKLNIDTDFKKLRENTLMGFSYDYNSELKGTKEKDCPTLRGVWINVNDFQGIIKPINK